MDSPLWPVHLHPAPGESLSSWIVRLSEAHGQKVHTFCTLAFGKVPLWNRDLDRFAPAAVLRTLAQRTATSDAVIAATTIQSLSGTVFDGSVDGGCLPWVLPGGIYHRVRRCFGQQYCPCCLAEDPSPYFRLHWRLAFVTVCPRHLCVLRDRCLQCGAPVMFFRRDLEDRTMPSKIAITRCARCRKSLLLGRVSSAPEDAIANQILLEKAAETGWFSVTDKLVVPTFLALHVVRHLANLLASRRSVALGWARALGVKADLLNTLPLKTIEYGAVHLRLEIVRAASHWLEGWPDEFFERCTRMGLTYSRLCGQLAHCPFWFEEEVRARMYDQRIRHSKQQILAGANFLSQTLGRQPTAGDLGRLFRAKDVTRSVRQHVRPPFAESVITETLSRVFDLVDGLHRNRTMRHQHRYLLRRDHAMAIAMILLGLSGRELATLRRRSAETIVLLRQAYSAADSTIPDLVARKALRRFRRYVYEQWHPPATLSPQSGHLLFTTVGGAPIGASLVLSRMQRLGVSPKAIRPFEHTEPRYLGAKGRIAALEGRLIRRLRLSRESASLE